MKMVLWKPMYVNNIKNTAHNENPTFKNIESLINQKTAPKLSKKLMLFICMISYDGKETTNKH